MRARKLVSTADYLAADLASAHKNEFWDGEIRAMAGASPAHVFICSSVVRELQQKLRQKCRVAFSDLRVRLSDLRYVYPDIVVVCDPPEYTDEKPPSLLNPTLIVEVISPSTGEVDRSEKLRAYTRLASVQAYWIVEQESPQVTTYERQGEVWALGLVDGLEADVRSEALGLSIPMRDIYDQVDLPPRPAVPASPPADEPPSDA
ncbi:MAG: Uma2 family endonuclease [Bacteroidota bacterium]